MPLEFLPAKNSSQSAKVNGIFLHSSYNPEAEAERFVQNLQADFKPTCLVILEGGLGYCLPFLRKRFPYAKIVCVRYCDDFHQFDKAWDFCIPLKNFKSLSQNLFDLLGEENLFQCLFYEWPASAKIWQEESALAWKEIKAAMEKAKSLLATREYFGKRWLKNKFLFFDNLNKICFLKKIEKPILICASGPSLEDAIPSIIKNRERVFLCALSSAIKPLATNNIQADLCLSSDGGYWAKKHLDALRKNSWACPLALNPEAACPSDLFKSKKILPLCYEDDALSKKLFEALKIEPILFKRNGTVSGSALDFFLSQSDENIFFAGLDLQNFIDKSHARPNALDTENERKDFRLSAKETREAKSSFYNPSLEIYAQWFCSKNLGSRNVYRIAGSRKFKRTLGQIKDIKQSEFEKLILENGSNKNEAFEFQEKYENEILNKNERAKKIQEIAKEAFKSDWLLNEIFPADFIMAQREMDFSQKEKRRLLIKEKSEKLFTEIFARGRKTN